jgi:hypothetical protein
MYGENHASVTAAAEPATATREVSSLICRKNSISRMGLARGFIDSQLVNEKAVRHIVGDEMQPDRFSLSYRNARRLKREPVSVDLDDARGFLSCSGLKEKNTGKRKQEQENEALHA